MPTIETYEKQGFIEISQSDFVSGISRRERQSRAVRRGKLHIGTHGSTSNVGSSSLKCPDTVFTELQLWELLGKPLMTEAEQLKLLECTYPVIQRMEGFKENNGWTLDTHPSVILCDLFSQFKAIGRFEDWSIENNDEGNYEIHVLEEYGDNRAQFIPIDWLSQLHQSNKRLHDIIVYAINLVIKNNGIWGYAEWLNFTDIAGNGGMINEWLFNELSELEEFDDGIIKIQDTISYYQKDGLPYKYYKLIVGCNASIRIFKQELDELENEKLDAFEAAALPFLKAAYLLANDGTDIRSLSDFANEEGYMQPMEYKLFVWTTDNQDLMFDKFTEHIDDKANNIGVRSFCWNEKLDADDNANIAELKQKCDLFQSFFDTAEKMVEVIAPKVKKNEQLFVGELSKSNYKPKPTKKQKDARKLINILV